MKNPFYFLMLSLLIVLSGCGEDGHMNAAHKYVEEIKTKPSKAIEPIPQVLPTPSIKYTLSAARDPFQRVVARNLNENAAPDTQRKKGVLEAYALDSLKMIGTITENNRAYVIISTPDNLIFSATVGDYLGQNYGKITSISPDKIGITENFKVNGEWQKRQASLVLTTEEEGGSGKSPPSPAKQ